MLYLEVIKMAKTKLGWIVLVTKFASKLIPVLAKVGGKLLGVLAKLFKGAKVGKLASAGISMGAWSILYSWKFALLIMLLLIVHESGHVFVMRQMGMRTKGIYFIPLLGAAERDKRETL
jgi:hypothetical protein